MKPVIVSKKIHQNSTLTDGRMLMNVTKVFILSSTPRTGSSFTSEMLAAMPQAAYFFEPFWLLLEKPTSNMSLKLDFASNLLNCRLLHVRDILFSQELRKFVIKKPIIGEDNSQHFRKKIKDCLKTSFRLLKAFSWRMKDVQQEMLR